MEVKRLHIVYFSPTGTTQSVLRVVARFLNIETMEHDVTDYTSRNVELQFGTNDLVIFGFPVYSGRVPKAFRDRLNDIKGQFTLAVLIATYGNRDYDDALFEMKNLVNQNGFRVLGAAAFVTEHSVVRSVATGRPDAKDMAFIKGFCMKLKKKAAKVVLEEHYSELHIPGKEPYRRYVKIPMAPTTSAFCTACGLCAKKCPVAAISVHNPRKTDKHQCIGCMRCVRVCPQKARHVSNFKMKVGEFLFTKVKRNRKEPEMFL